MTRRMPTCHHILAMALSLLGVLALSAAFADDSMTARLPDNLAETAIMSNGTGFFVNAQGTVVTARHVVEDCKKILVMKNRYLFPVRRAVIANNMDISLLFPTINGAEPALFEEDNTLQDGELVYFLGDNDLRLAPNDRPLLANAFIAKDQAQESTEYLFNIMGYGTPGYSGGPVLNEKGHVIGLILGRRDVMLKIGRVVAGVSSNVLSVTPIAIKKLLDANKVPYQMANPPAGKQLPAQVMAEKISVGVICLK